MQFIINYASGGLGNRLKPLGSCYIVSQQTNRQLTMTWDLAPACSANFNVLFKNDIPIIDLKSLDPAEVSIYSEPEWIEHDFRLNGSPNLYNLYSKSGCKNLSRCNEMLTDTKKYIIVYSNTVLQGFEQIQPFIKLLQPIDELNKKINHFITLNNIDKNTIGVHARGTDFSGMSANSYIPAMKHFTNKFYVCSDSKEIEFNIKNEFGNRVIVREKRYVDKYNKSSSTWVNNILRTSDSVQDAVVDLYILSKTNFQIYNKDSSFAEIAKLL
jgi:hypothetical protein